MFGGSRHVSYMPTLEAQHVRFDDELYAQRFELNENPLNHPHPRSAEPAPQPQPSRWQRFVSHIPHPHIPHPYREWRYRRIQAGQPRVFPDAADVDDANDAGAPPDELVEVDDVEFPDTADAVDPDAFSRAELAVYDDGASEGDDNAIAAAGGAASGGDNNEAGEAESGDDDDGLAKLVSQIGPETRAVIADQMRDFRHATALPSPSAAVSPSFRHPAHGPAMFVHYHHGHVVMPFYGYGHGHPGGYGGHGHPAGYGHGHPGYYQGGFM